jgi:hypothetical protein
MRMRGDAGVVDVSLIAVQSERIVPAFFDPEVAIETLPQRRRVALEPSREFAVVPDGAGEACRTQPRIVGVPLNLAGCDGG